MSDESARPGRGSMEVITGCMFSGKSELLLARLAHAWARGVSAVAFKHASDNRYGRQDINSHNGQRAEAICVPEASRILELAAGVGLIAVDEGQFFGSELVDVCRQLLLLGSDVVVAGLDLDSWGLPFGPMPELERMADRLTRLHAVCACCGQPADHTQRIAPIESGSMVGGAEAYEPRCAGCFKAPPAQLRR
jgi:thymidine kinase